MPARGYSVLRLPRYTAIRFQGRIDDVQIYDRALTAEEMAILATLQQRKRIQA